MFKKSFDAALKELDAALKEHYSEDDPRFFTFYDYALYINRCEKEEREERDQRERDHRYNSDSDFRDIPYHDNLVSDTESDSD